MRIWNAIFPATKNDLRKLEILIMATKAQIDQAVIDLKETKEQLMQISEDYVTLKQAIADLEAGLENPSLDELVALSNDVITAATAVNALVPNPPTDIPAEPLA